MIYSAIQVLQIFNDLHFIFNYTTITIVFISLTENNPEVVPYNLVVLMFYTNLYKFHNLLKIPMNLIFILRTEPSFPRWKYNPHNTLFNDQQTNYISNELRN